MSYNILSKVINKVLNTGASFVRTQMITVGNTATVEGFRFNQFFDIEFAGDETRYFLYELPSDSQVTVALQNRTFRSRTGAAEFEILWRSTGFTPGTPVKVFNEYNKYEDNEKMVVSEISAPADEGVIRETNFLTASGTGVNAVGSVSAQLGFRLYEPGTFFIVKVTNLDNSTNRITLGYTWLELSDGKVIIT